jgi:hypothetical protein
MNNKWNPIAAKKKKADLRALRELAAAVEEGPTMTQEWVNTEAVAAVGGLNRKLLQGWRSACIGICGVSSTRRAANYPTKQGWKGNGSVESNQLGHGDMFLSQHKNRETIRLLEDACLTEFRKQFPEIPLTNTNGGGGGTLGIMGEKDADGNIEWFPDPLEHVVYIVHQLKPASAGRPSGTLHQFFSSKK